MPSIHERELVEALSSPSAYPHAVDRVDLHRTHISLVFLAGDRAYKVKRSVDLGFLDFTELDRRRFYCDEEIRLNRRLAPGTYLGVVGIARGDDGMLRVDGPGEIVEWAVAMQRLPPSGMLDRLLDRGELDHPALDALADLLVDFHARCATGAGVDEHGAPEAVQRKILANLDDMTAERDPEGGPLFAPPLVEHLRAWTTRFVSANRGLLERRVAEHRIREGHGDLHAGNICRVGNDWIVYDCIEFRPDFRSVDVAAELAFLAMDLAAHGFPAAGRRLVHHYAERAGDAELATLCPLYASYYAAVRAKVDGLRGLQADATGPGTEPESDHDHALRHLLLAVGFTLSPALVVMCGLPGTGKSAVARTIAAALDAAIVRSDVVRKRLAGLSPADRSGQGDEHGLYGADSTERTCTELARLAAEALTRGRSVVVDATNATRSSRDAFAAVARDAGVPAWLVWLDTPPAVVRARLRGRAADTDEPSDADEAVYERLRERFERPDEWPFDRLVVIGDAPSPERAAERLLVGMAASGG